MTPYHIAASFALVYACIWLLDIAQARYHKRQSHQSYMDYKASRHDHDSI